MAFDPSNPTGSSSSTFESALDLDLFSASTGEAYSLSTIKQFCAFQTRGDLSTQFQECVTRSSWLVAKNYEKIMSMEQEIMMHGGEELDGADPSVFGAERKGKEQR